MKQLIPLFFLIVTPVIASTWHVATDGDDSWPGTSAQPFLTIARSVEAAAFRDTILIQDGIYTGQGNRDLDCGNKYLTIRSISGNPESCIIDAELASTGTGWIFPRSESIPSLAGLTMRNGVGGGVSVLVFAGIIENCRFENFYTGLDVSASEVLVRDCEFVDCVVGIRQIFDYPLEVEGCVFSNNDYGMYGIGSGSGPSVWFTGCEFFGNRVAAIQADHLYGGWVSVVNTEIRNNLGPGIIVNNGGYTAVINSKVVCNGGGGIVFGGSGDSHFSAYMRGSQIVGNSGIGIDFNLYEVLQGYGEISVSDCTIADNLRGGFAFVQPSADVSVQFARTIVAFNNGEALVDQGASYTNCVVYGNGVDNLADSWQPGVAGNIAKDPLFCDTLGGNYSIAANSPCAPSELHDLIGAGAVACAGIPAAVMLAVEDIPADQGGQVRLTWYRSGHDEAGSDYPILGYDVYRRVDKDALATRPAPGTKLLGWDYLLRVPARGDQGYQVVVPTLCDAAADGTLCPTVFLVSAVTEDPLVFFDSLPDSGSSIDNLAPGVPSNLSVAYSPTGNVVSWLAPGDPDISRYEVWRTTGAAPGEGPGEPTAVIAQTQWLDSGYTGSAWDQTYWVAAVDAAGNRGPLTEWSSAGVSAVGESDVPRTYALHGNIPNPFNPSTTLRFDLPRSAQVDLAIYDVAGRRVRHLVAGETYPAGRHEMIWDGRNDAGLSVGSGVYLYRLDAGEYRETKRMALVR